MRHISNSITWIPAFAIVLTGLVPCSVSADARSKAVQEVAESVMARFGAKAARSVPALAQKIEAYAARYGEEALLAVRRMGPEAFALVDAAGVNGARAVRVLAEHGEVGATWILRRPKAMQQLLQYGEEAASVLVKHPGIAEPLVERGGVAAIRALEAVTPQSARRIAILMEEGLGNAGKSPELLEVIAKYGDRAATFVWENKGALAVGATLTAFVTDPEPFLNGAVKLTATAAETVARPLAEGVARGTCWTVVVLVLLLGGGAVLAVKLGLFRRSPPGKGAAEKAPPSQTPKGSPARHP